MQTDGRTHMTKQVVAFRNFANAHKNYTFCPRGTFKCFGWTSEQSAIISLHRLVFITDLESDYFAVRTGSLNVI